MRIEIKERCPMSEADCDVHNCGMNCKEAEAQRRLFDAAPDLLAALEQIIREDNESGEVSDDAILSAVQAVAKALGEG